MTWFEGFVPATYHSAAASCCLLACFPLPAELLTAAGNWELRPKPYNSYPSLPHNIPHLSALSTSRTLSAPLQHLMS